MRIRFGSKTISLPSARWPKLNVPQLRILSALRIPLPTTLRFGSAKTGLLSLFVVGVGFAGTIFMVVAGTNNEILFPKSGAEYELPSVIGEALDPDPETPSESSQTLRIGLKDGARLDQLVLSNLDLGKASLAKSFEVIRNSSTGVTGSNAYIWVGEVVITQSSAPTLAWDNMSIGNLSLGARVDGHTNEVQIDQTIPEIIIDSDRGSGTYAARDSVVDRVILQINGSTGASIGRLEITDVDSSVGAWDWDYLKIGTLTMDSTNKFGDGSGIDSASATFGTGISSRSVTDNLVDTPISVR